MEAISVLTPVPSSMNNGTIKSFGVSIVSATIERIEGVCRKMRLRRCRYIFEIIYFSNPPNHADADRHPATPTPDYQAPADNCIPILPSAEGSSKYSPCDHPSSVRITSPGRG